MKKQIKYIFNEDVILKELQEYVDGTYSEHYSQNKYQATDFIVDSGHGEGFFIGNIMKYTQRYGKKDGKNRKDLLKVIHYAIMALSIHEEEDNVLKEKFEYHKKLITSDCSEGIIDGTKISELEV